MKPGGAAPRALEPHHLLDPIETAERRFQLRDRVESAQPEGLKSLLGTKIGADLAFELQLSRDPRQLAGGHQQGAGNGRRRIVADRGRRAGGSSMPNARRRCSGVWPRESAEVDGMGFPPQHGLPDQVRQ